MSQTEIINLSGTKKEGGALQCYLKYKENRRGSTSLIAQVLPQTIIRKGDEIYYKHHLQNNQPIPYMVVEVLERRKAIGVIGMFTLT